MGLERPEMWAFGCPCKIATVGLCWYSDVAINVT
jgi:hypothetical protein